MASIKVLIIEDEWVTSEAMSSQLQHSGYQVLGVCASGEEALRMVDEQSPDVIFMDIQLAGKMDGVETARELKKKGDFPIIFLSNFADQETMDRVNSVHPAAYLLKPFMIRQLQVCIGTALHNAAHRKSASLMAEPDNTDLVRFKDHLFIREQNGTFKKYRLHNILFIRADRAYADLFTDEGKITQSVSMGTLFQKIAHPDLIQVHRSYIVNIQRIDALKGNLLLIAEHEIPVSDQYKAALHQKIPLLK